MTDMYTETYTTGAPAREKVYTHGVIQDAGGTVTHHMHPPGERDQMAVAETWLTVREFAARMKVGAETVRRWLRTGQVHGTRLGDRAGWRIPDSEILRLMPDVGGCHLCARGVPLFGPVKRIVRDDTACIVDAETGVLLSGPYRLT